jgi:hypothetical protein
VNSVSGGGGYKAGRDRRALKLDIAGMNASEESLAGTTGWVCPQLEPDGVDSHACFSKGRRKDED